MDDEQVTLSSQPMSSLGLIPIFFLQRVATSGLALSTRAMLLLQPLAWHSSRCAQPPPCYVSTKSAAVSSRRGSP